jgi:predicted 3-demethylubiquinone-9 3-methyltransferase (glyoxalase superfamily)
MHQHREDPKTIDRKGTAMAVVRFATHLWYDDQAEEAAELYTRLLPDSHIDAVTRAPEGIPDIEPGSVFFLDLTLQGNRFIFLNGGPQFPFNEQVSLYVCLDTQEEVDRLWDALLENGGTPSQCGWLTDRFGLSWQVIPKRFEELMSDPDPALVGRVTKAMLQMQKLETSELEAAARGA